MGEEYIFSISQMGKLKLGKRLISLAPSLDRLIWIQSRSAKPFSDLCTLLHTPTPNLLFLSLMVNLMGEERILPDSGKILKQCS